MELTILGRSPSFPNPGVASSSYLVSQDETRLIVDAGHGSGASIRAALDLESITAIVISHMHPDHYFDLIPLRYAFHFLSLGTHVPLYLPPGGMDVLTQVGKVVDLPDGFFAGTYAVCEYDPSGTLEVGDLTVSFAPTNHFIPGWAVRVASRGDNRTLVYSSDTGPSETVRDLARGADLFVVEATVNEYPDGPFNGHLTGSGAGEMAREAGVRRVLLTHYADELADAVLAAARQEFGSAVDLAVEGATYRV